MHPYMFVARQGFKEMLETPNATDKTIPLLARIVPALRAALVGATKEYPNQAV